MIRSRCFFYILLALGIVVLVNQDVVSQRPYGVGGRADNKIDSLIDNFFRLRYSDPEKARMCAAEAQSLSGKINDNENYSVATECLGLSDYYAGKFIEARRNLLKALMLYNDARNQRGVSSACNNLAMIEQDQGNLTHAIQLYLIALRSDSLSADIPGKGYTLNNIGTAYLYKGELKTALIYFEKARKLAEETGDYELVVNTMINTAIFYLESKRFEEALALNEATLSKAKKAHDDYSCAMIAVNVGDVYREMGKYNLAWASYQNGLEQAHNINSPELTADCLSNMGQLLQRQHNPTLANDYFIQALKIYEELGNRKKIGGSFTAMGVNLIQKSYYEKAIDYFRQSLLLVEPIGAMPEMAANYRQMGLAWAALGNMDSAGIYVDRFANTTTMMKTSDAELLLPDLPDSIAVRLKDLIEGESSLVTHGLPVKGAPKGNRWLWWSGLLALLCVSAGGAWLITGSVRRNRRKKNQSSSLEE